MTTIEERVSKACVTLNYAMLYSDVTSPCLITKSDAIYIVEEQDRIARKEEREKAELNFCIACDRYDCCEQRYDCKLFNKFSKAMKA